MQGPQGETGAAGQDGYDGADGNFNLGDAGTLAVGGLIGPNVVGGTGLLANTGDTENRNAILSYVLEETGQEVSDISIFLADVVDKMAPGAAPVTGTVVDVLNATGQSLVMTANGEAYLVDALLAAPGSLVTANLGAATLLGDVNAQTLIGVSTLSGGDGLGDTLSPVLGDDDDDGLIGGLLN